MASVIQNIAVSTKACPNILWVSHGRQKGGNLKQTLVHQHRTNESNRTICCNLCDCLSSLSFYDTKFNCAYRGRVDG